MPAQRTIYQGKLGAKEFLIEVAEHIQSEGKLFSQARAQEVASDLKIKPEEVVNSVPWYLKQEKEFLKKGVALPRFTSLQFLRRGPRVRFCEHRIYRIVNNQKAIPILFEEDAILLITSGTEYSHLMVNARQCSAAVNSKYYGPGESRLRNLITAYKKMCQEMEADGPPVQKEGTALEAVRSMGTLGGRFQAEGELTATQKAEIFREYLAKAGALAEAVQAGNEVKKSAGARAGKAIEALNRAIDVEAEVVRGVNHDNAMLGDAMNKTNEMAAHFFGLPGAAPVAAPLRQIEAGAAAAAVAPIAQGMANLNIAGEKENIVATPERRPNKGRAKSARSKKKPIKFADEWAGDGYGID